MVPTNGINRLSNAMNYPMKAVSSTNHAINVIFKPMVWKPMVYRSLNVSDKQRPGVRRVCLSPDDSTWCSTHPSNWIENYKNPISCGFKDIDSTFKIFKEQIRRISSIVRPASLALFIFCPNTTSYRSWAVRWFQSQENGFRWSLTFPSEATSVFGKWTF